MKYFFLMLLFFTINCNAQTKKETEDWIIFYLDKYFGSVDSFGQDTYQSYSYTFDKNKFVCLSSWYQRSNAKLGGKIPDKLYQSRTYLYDLSRVEKISYDIYDDTLSNGGIQTSHPFQCSIDFYFKFIDISSPTVITYNNLEKKDESAGYTTKCTPIYGVDKGALKDTLLPRLVKAFEHLVTLDGGKLLKEAF